MRHRERKREKGRMGKRERQRERERYRKRNRWKEAKRRKYYRSVHSHTSVVMKVASLLNGLDAE